MKRLRKHTTFGHRRDPAEPTFEASARRAFGTVRTTGISLKTKAYRATHGEFHYPSWHPTKIQAVGLIILLAMGTLFLVDQDLKVVISGKPGGPVDPNSIIWQSTDPNTNGAEFNYEGFNYTSNCKGTVDCLTSIPGTTSTFLSDSGFAAAWPTASISGISVNVNDTIVILLESHGTSATVSDTQSNTYTERIENSTGCCNGFTVASTIWTATASSSGSMTVNFASVDGGAHELVTVWRNIVGIGDVKGTVKPAPQGATGITTLNFTSVSTNDFVITGMILTYSGTSGITWSAVSPSETVLDARTGLATPNAGFAGSSGMYATGNSGDVSYRADWASPPCHQTSLCSAVRTGLRIIGKGGVSIPSIAITKSQIGDLSISHSKTLGLNYTWAASPTLSGRWGMFLTSNSTIPATSTYDPYTDPNVAYLLQMSCTSSCSTTSPTIRVELYFLRTIGQGHTLQSEDSGCSATAPGSGSCFVAFTLTINPDPSGVFNYNMALLNFTGTTQTNPVCVFGAGVFGGNGCSWLHTGRMPSPPINATNYVTVSRVIPWLQTTTPYYLGFFKTSSATTVRFGFQNLDVYTYNTGTPVNQPPNFDTGGFFGPVIKALINLGIWMFQQMLLSIAVIAGVVEVAGNAIGNFFGLGNLGTAMINFLSGVANFVANVFTTVFGWSVTFASLFAGSIAVFSNFISGSFGFVTWIISWFTSLSGIWQIIQDFWTAINTVVLSMNAILVFYYIIGMFMVYMDGWKGFKEWLEIGETFTLKLVKVGWWVGNEMRTVILDIKQLIVNWL